MEVVVTLSECGKSGDDVVSRRMSVLEWLISEPVRQRVYTESCVVDKDETEDTSIEVATTPIAPAKSSDQHWEDESHENCDFTEVLVLPHDNRVGIEICNICSADLLRVLFQYHPTKMGVPKAFSYRVWVFLRVGVSVMSTVISGPPSDRALHGSTTKSRQDESEYRRSCVGSVSPISVVPSRDPETGAEVVDQSPDCGLILQLCRESAIYSDHRNDYENGDVEPIEVLVPIGSRPCLIDDVIRI